MQLWVNQFGGSIYLIDEVHQPSALFLVGHWWWGYSKALVDTKDAFPTDPLPLFVAILVMILCVWIEDLQWRHKKNLR